MILDEASLAGTLSLDLITALAAGAVAKVLLVGDYAQLQAVDAGGAFGLLAHSLDDVPELVDVHRFTNEWEKTASLDLRHGRAEVIDVYEQHGRIADGETEAMVDAAYAAWRADRAAGRAKRRCRPGATRGCSVLLPAGYVAADLELGYAVTSHRAQGVTTDTAHVLVDASMTRENLYVAMTRGREANRAYAAVARPDVSHFAPHPAPRR